MTFIFQVYVIISNDMITKVNYRNYIFDLSSWYCEYLFWLSDICSIIYEKREHVHVIVHKSNKNVYSVICGAQKQYNIKVN